MKVADLQNAYDRNRANRLSRISVEGQVVDAIAQQAEAVAADLVVMPTHGPDGLADHLFGTTTEHALHRVRRPLLAVPLVSEGRVTGAMNVQTYAPRSPVPDVWRGGAR